MKKRGKLCLALPEEIINQIITSSGLDLKSMIKCMVVCKEWRNLVADNSLVPKGQFLVYVPQRRFGALDDETNQIAWMYGEPRQTSNGYIMPSCNGLVCFLPAYNAKNIDICNPLTGEHITITYPRRQGYIRQFNLGFCPSSNEYKLTCLTSCTLDIYTLGSPARWRSVPFHHEELYGLNSDAVCVNGVFHWLLEPQSILTFDLAMEVMGSIPLPYLEDDKEVYQMECMDHCLVVTTYNPMSGLEIWVRKEDKSSGESVWTKNWVIDAAQPFIGIDIVKWLVPQKLSTDGHIIMRDNHYNLYSYNSRDKLVRHHWRDYNIQLHSYYTPTLISLKNLMQKNRQEWSRINKDGK